MPSGKLVYLLSIETDAYYYYDPGALQPIYSRASWVPTPIQIFYASLDVIVNLFDRQLEDLQKYFVPPMLDERSLPMFNHDVVFHFEISILIYKESHYATKSSTVAKKRPSLSSAVDPTSVLY